MYKKIKRKRHKNKFYKCPTSYREESKQMIECTRYIAPFEIIKGKLYKYEATRNGSIKRYIHHANEREKNILIGKCICIYSYSGHNLVIEKVYKVCKATESV